MRNEKKGFCKEKICKGRKSALKKVLVFYSDLYHGTFPDTVLGAVAVCYELELLSCRNDSECGNVVVLCALVLPSVPGI